MTEKKQSQNVEHEIKQYLIIKCLKEKDFKKEFIKDPKATLEKEFKCKLPETAQVNVIEETRNSKWFVIPFIADAEELSEEELKAIVGGETAQTQEYKKIGKIGQEVGGLAGGFIEGSAEFFKALERMFPGR